MTTSEQEKALVLFSGGQDSTIALFQTLTRFAHVETIGFSYGQRHKVELSCRQNVLTALREKFPDKSAWLFDDHVLELSTLGQISDTALTGEAEIALLDSGLPNTFVPGRNLLFFTYAAALAYRRSICVLVGGMCETDFSGYPDCRNETLQSLASSISLGMDRAFTIETPLMFMDKAQSWQLAFELGGNTLIDLVIEHTHTCYKGERDRRHDWGYGCAACPACELRANGFLKWRRKNS